MSRPSAQAFNQVENRPASFPRPEMHDVVFRARVPDHHSKARRRGPDLMSRLRPGARPAAGAAHESPALARSCPDSPPFRHAFSPVNPSRVVGKPPLWPDSAPFHQIWDAQWARHGVRARFSFRRGRMFPRDVLDMAEGRMLIRTAYADRARPRRRLAQGETTPWSFSPVRMIGPQVARRTACLREGGLSMGSCLADLLCSTS